MEIKSTVYPTTTDYDKFVRLLGNRSIREVKIQAILNSIIEDGVIDSPVVVNERWEIIDGQHHFEAFKRLGIPVPYVIKSGYGIKECIIQNAIQSSWCTNDFIASYAELGDKNYRLLQEILDEYGDIPFSSILRIISRKRNGGRAFFGKEIKGIRYGKFTISDEIYLEVIEELEYLNIFALFRKKNRHGHSDVFYDSIALCYECPEVDNVRLKERMVDNPERFEAFNSISDCLNNIQDIYNLYARKKVYVASEVAKMLDKSKKNLEEKEIA